MTRALLAILLVSSPAGAVELVEFNAPQGEHVYVNPSGVTQLRGQKAVPRGLYHKSVKCMIISDGQAIPVTEDCPTVRNRLSGEK